MPSLREIEAEKADLANGRDIAQEVIEHCTALLREIVPVPCSAEDAGRIKAGEQPQGPTGLRYLAQELTTATYAAKLAATSDVSLFVSNNETDRWKALEHIVTNLRLSEIEAGLRREILIGRALPLIAQQANKLPGATADEQPAILRELQQILADTISECELATTGIWIWDDNAKRFSEELAALIATPAP